MSAGARPRYVREIESQKSGRDLGWHTHEFGQFFSAIRGSMYVGTHDRVLLLSPAMAMWIPPDVEHWLRYVSANEIIYVDVSRAESDRLGAAPRIVQMTPLLHALMHRTPDTGPSGLTKPHKDALYDLLFHEFLTARDVPLSIAMPQDKRISELALAAMDDPGSIASVDEWLTGAMASRKTIERLFITETGMPPSRWLRHVRILQAVSQLAAGKKISSVAFDLGYESPSAFTYMFRSAIGLSPRIFRQRGKSVGQ